MLFKQGFWRWVVASVSCLVQSRFWNDAGQVSAVLGVFPLHAHSKASLHWECADTAWPFQKQLSLHLPPWADKDGGAVPGWGGARRGVCVPRVLQGLSPGGKATERHRSIPLPAHGEASPRGKYQCAIRVLLPLRFGRRSLMSGGKQIKSHRMPAGEWKRRKLARKWFCMTFCPA